MRRKSRTVLGGVLALAIVLAMAFSPALSPSSCMMKEAEVEALSLSEVGQFAPHRSPLGYVAGDGAASPRLPAAAVTAAKPVQVPAPAVSGDNARKPPAGNTEAPAETPPLPPADPPATARIDPLLAGPTDLTVTYDPKAPGNRKNTPSWTNPYPDTGIQDYLAVEWDDADFASMSDIFDSLVTHEASAEEAADDFDAHTAQVWQPGLTYAQRLEIIDLIEGDLDSLFDIFSGSTQQEVWTLWDDLLALRTVFNDGGVVSTKDSTYKRKQLSLDKYYFYVVLARYASGDTSPPTNSWGMFTYWESAPAPAQPAGFTANAYDPGVGLEWEPNTETYLAGYNVYVEDFADPLNGATPITFEAEYFHMTGETGATYYVEAVNVAELTSTQASAVSVLAPAATIYDADSTAWGYSGSWAREDYRTGDGGRLLRVGHWGDASVPPYDPAPSEPPGAASASLTFTGRRIQVYSARYFMCGSVNFYIDDTLKETFNLYYDGGYYDGSYGTGAYTPPLWQQMSFEITGLSKGQHTLVIEAVGSGGEQGSHFINFEYAESRGP
jgi:hypothetical protein